MSVDPAVLDPAAQELAGSTSDPSVVVEEDDPPDEGDQDVEPGGGSPDSTPSFHESDGVDSQAEAPAPRKPTAARKARKKSAKRAVRKKASTAARPASNRSAAHLAKYPRHSVERALRIPRALHEQNGGNPATIKEAARFTGIQGVSGDFRTEVSSAKKYGFLRDEDGHLVLEPRARRAISPQSSTDRRDALREAVLAAPDLSAVYNFYRGESLPDDQFFINALTDRFGIPLDKVTEFLTIFNESIRVAELLDEGGERPRLIDVGRDEAHRPASPARAKASVEAGTTCFVMQPFGGTLGTYYDSIFKPAIEQAGLTPIRADAEIFGTGKIMDQIWRGIGGARVLVAELTSKNPNVFYELGLAHALEKPVVLVSSNQDDVPFDLRHIRAIFYDQSDPFWGQKLIDKIADNIKSAVTNPEEAIFRVDDA
jgi:hypothetical protein